MRPLLLALAPLLLLTGGHAGGQPPKPDEPLPVLLNRDGRIIAQYGALRTLKLPQNKIPTEIMVNDEGILSVRMDPNNPGALLLWGRGIGSTTLTVTWGDKAKESYEIVIEAPRKQFAKLLRPGFVAFALSLPPENAVGGFVGLDDYVIVYCTKKTDPENTKTLVKNVRVLSEMIRSPESKTQLYVFLEVTTDEAKLLRSGTECGTLALGLVAEADTKNEKALQDRKGDSESVKK